MLLQILSFFSSIEKNIELKSTGLAISGMICRSIPSLVLAQGHTVLYEIKLAANPKLPYQF